MSDLPPGFHHGLTFAEYCEIPALNASALKYLAYTPAHFRAYLDGLIARPVSKDLDFGLALHCRLLEPAEYAARFTASEPCSAPVGSGVRKGEPCGAPGQHWNIDGWRCNRHGNEHESQLGDVTVLSPDEAARVEAAAASVKQHEVSRLLRRPGGFEASMVFDYLGHRCKGRLDKWIDAGQGTIIDVKKVGVGGCERSKFARQLQPTNQGGLGYAFQAQFYRRGVEALTGKLPRWFWLVVEDSPPHAVKVYELEEPTADLADVEIKLALQRVKQATDAGTWEAYPRQVESIGYSEWVIKQAINAGAIEG